MRLAFALVSSLLLLAASTAAAEPQPSSQGAAAPRGQPAPPGPVAAEFPAPGQPSPSVKRAAYPTPDSGARIDRQSEANCYYVFGDLRCDRIAVRRPK